LVTMYKKSSKAAARRHSYICSRSKKAKKVPLNYPKI
jgi:hypothetical protein